MNRFRTLFSSLLIALAALTFAPAAFAGDPEVDAALESGLVGERVDGYLGIVGDVSPSVRRKVQEINNQRRALYEQRAEENNVSVESYGRVMGEKLVERLDEDQMFMTESGTWERK